MKKPDSRRTVRSVASHGLLIALALILSYVEARVPAFFAFPGMKLGLTNIVVLIALYRMGGVSAMTVNLLRIVLVSLLFGTFSSFVYSMAGGMLSTTVMLLLRYIGKFRPVTVSIAGGVSHNVGQIIAAMVIMSTAGIGWYLSVLWFTGLISGALIGILGSLLIKRLPSPPA
ncbi:MAG: Gx transporter family protein [Clostridia bacterium]|nr:Gx transporter family protein [Clostridia bacterium]